MDRRLLLLCDTHQLEEKTQREDPEFHFILWLSRIMPKSLIIALCMAIVLIASTTALALKPSPALEHIISISEWAGKDIADQEAQNWKPNAKLIQIGISRMALVKKKDGTLELETTGWSYLYRSDAEYLRVLIDIDDYVNNTARSEELSKEEIEEQKLNKKNPLVDWDVVSWNALKIASEDYCMSLERGDTIYSLYIDMREVKGIARPVWHISIMHGTTGIITDYLIDAMDGEILRVEGPTYCSSPLPLPSPESKQDQGINGGIIGNIIGGIFTIIGAIIGGIFAIIAAIIGAIIGARRRKHD